MSENLGLFKVKPGSYLAKLNKNNFLIGQTNQQIQGKQQLPGQQLQQLFGQAQTRGGGIKKLNMRGKNQPKNAPTLVQTTGKELLKTVKSQSGERVDEISKGLLLKIRGRSQNGKILGASEESLEQAKKLIVDLGVDPEVLINIKLAKDDTILINLATFLLALPESYPQIDADGYKGTESINLREEANSVLHSISPDLVPISSVSQPASSTASDASMFSTEAQLRKQKEEEQKARNAIANGEAPAQGAGGAASVNSFLNKLELAKQQLKEEEKAKGPSGGVLSATSSSFNPDSLLESSIGSDLSAELYFTAGSSESVKSLKKFMDMFPGLTTSSDISIDPESERTFRNSELGIYERDASVSSSRRQQSLDSILGAFASTGSSQSASFTTDRDRRDSIIDAITSMSSEFPGLAVRPRSSTQFRTGLTDQSSQFGTASQISGTQLYSAPPDPYDPFYSSSDPFYSARLASSSGTFDPVSNPLQPPPPFGQPPVGRFYVPPDFAGAAGQVPPDIGNGGAAGGGAGAGAGAPAGGGANGPDNNQLNQDERDMKLAKLIAEQNAKIQIAILKSQRKAGLKPFLSTEEMNEITFARNLDARKMKAENFYKDYQNANNQDMQRLLELQRYYNDMYRVPLAK